MCLNGSPRLMDLYRSRCTSLYIYSHWFISVIKPKEIEEIRELGKLGKLGGKEYFEN